MSVMHVSRWVEVQTFDDYLCVALSVVNNALHIVTFWNPRIDDKHCSMMSIFTT